MCTPAERENGSAAWNTRLVNNRFPLKNTVSKFMTIQRREAFIRIRSDEIRNHLCWRFVQVFLDNAVSKEKRTLLLSSYRPSALTSSYRFFHFLREFEITYVLQCRQKLKTSHDTVGRYAAKDIKD